MNTHLSALTLGLAALVFAGCSATPNTEWRIAESGVNAATSEGIQNLLRQADHRLEQTAAREGWRLGDAAKCWAAAREGGDGEPWLLRGVVCGPATTARSLESNPWIEFLWADVPLDAETEVEFGRPNELANLNSNLTLFRPGEGTLDVTEAAQADLPKPDAPPVARDFSQHGPRPPADVPARAPGISVELPGETLKIDLLAQTDRFGDGPDSITAPPDHQLVTLALEIFRHDDLRPSGISIARDSALSGRVLTANGQNPALTDALGAARRSDSSTVYATLAVPNGDPTVEIDTHGQTIAVELPTRTVRPDLPPTVIIERPGRVPDTTVDLADGGTLTTGWKVGQAAAVPRVSPYGWADEGNQWLVFTVADPRWDREYPGFRLCPITHRSVSEDAIEVVDQDGNVTTGADVDEDGWIAVQVPKGRRFTVTISEVRDIELKCVPEAGVERHEFGSVTFDIRIEE